MKRYIRASFDSSMPSWLKGEFDKTKLGDVFVKKYGLALSDIKFLDAPTTDSIKIYNLVGDNGYTKVYIPGVNEDDEILLNGRWRKLGGIAKSKLDGMTQDIAYIDRSSAPKRPSDRGYQDPRYYYGRYSGKQGAYCGQHQRTDGTWTSSGSRGASESLYRDKSGYSIPSPEMRLARYYRKFPEKITQRVDAVYQRILEVKDKVLSPDIINSPRTRDEQMSPGNAIYRLRDAIDEYRDLLAKMEDFGKEHPSLTSRDNALFQRQLITTVSNSIKRISDCLNDAEKYLTSRW